MKIFSFAIVILFAMQASTYGQSDLRKIGQFLDNIRRAQNQNQQPVRPPQEGPPRKTFGGDPNQSGDKNQGDFNRPGFIVNPQPGNPRPGRPGTVYPGQTYPGQPYPGQTYPGQTYPGQVVYPQNPSPGTQYGEPPRAPRKVYSNLPIKIRCAPDCVGTCNYQLIPASGQTFPYTIRANQTQNLKETTDWLCRYQPYSGAAYQTYRLRGGRTYEMRRDNNRWQLYLVP